MPLCRPTANLVLEDTVERIYHQDVFAELKLGLYLIRGENVVLLGEIVRLTSGIPSCHRFVSYFTYNIVLPLLCAQDLDQEDDVPLRQVDWSTLEPYHLKNIADKKQRDEFKASILFEKRGFCKEGGEGDGY